MLVGGEHADGEHRLEQDDPGGPGGVLHRQRPGGLKGDVGGVHRVGLAVHQPHPDVDERIAGRHPEVELAQHALLHRGDELPGDRAADHLVDELPATAGRQRLHLDVADRVLTVAAGLFDVPAGAPRRSAQRLPQRHPRRHPVDVHAVAGPQPFDDDVAVRLAHAPQHELAALGAVLHRQARVLRGEAGQRGRQLVLRALRARADRHGQLRPRYRPRLQQDGVVRAGQGVTGLRGGQFRHDTQVTGPHDLRRPLPGAAGRPGDPRDPPVVVVVGMAAFGPAVPTDVDGRVRAQRPGEHPDQ